MRKGIYHLLSVSSGTGQQSLYAAQWANGLGGVALVAILLAMAFGGMASSTAGGIKAFRIGVTVKGLIWRVRQSLASQSAMISGSYHHFSKAPVNAEILSSAFPITLLYMFTYITGASSG